MVSIDVNSGKSIRQKNVESTALDTNLEAAEEIARQIKIRDLSGLIIIDFIDMMSFGNRRVIERKLKEKCRNDSARIQIGRISSFGLLEMSRQRLRESSVKWKISITNETFALKILKLLEINAVNNKAKIIDVNVCEQINDYITKNLFENIKYIENKNKIKINLKINNSLIIPDYEIVLKNKSKKVIDTVQEISKLEYREEKINNVVNLKPKKDRNIYKKNNFKKKSFYKKKYYKKVTK